MPEQEISTKYLLTSLLVTASMIVPKLPIVSILTALSEVE